MTAWIGYKETGGRGAGNSPSFRPSALAKIFVAEKDARNASLDDIVEAVDILEDVCPKLRRTLGPDHPLPKGVQGILEKLQKLKRAISDLERQGF